MIVDDGVRTSFAIDDPGREAVASKPELLAPAGDRECVRAAVASGAIARRDPVVLAEWLVRIAVSLMLTPPPVEPAEFLAEVLLPALTP